MRIMGGAKTKTREMEVRSEKYLPTVSLYPSTQILDANMLHWYDVVS